MSLREIAAADAALILGSSDTESVIRWPCGVSGNAATVSGIWEPDETPQRMASVDGDQALTTGSLHLLSSVAVHDDDVWVIEGKCYGTLTVGVVCGGMRTLTLQLRDGKAITRHRGEMY